MTVFQAGLTGFYTGNGSILYMLFERLKVISQTAYEILQYPE